MIIIAIDPGYDRVGIAVIEKKEKEIILYSECFQTNSKDDFYTRLHQIGNHVKNIIKKYKPSCMAIEHLFFAKNTKTALEVSEARGVIIFQALESSISVYDFTPNQIKAAVTGHGNAVKKDVHKMIKHLISLDVHKKYIDDEIDAIAIGLTFFASPTSLLK